MLKAITLRAFPEDMDWKKCMKEAHLSGYEGVEANFDGRFSLDCPLETLEEIKKVAKENEIKVVSVYSRQQWETPISSGHKEKRAKGEETLKKLIEIAEFLQAPTVLTIPGAVDNSILSTEVEILPYDEVYERAKETIARLSLLAEKKGVILALENVPNKFLLSPLEMKQFIEEIGTKAVGCQFDVANCLYNGGIPEDWIRILGKHIKAIHLKDYRVSVGDLEGFVNIFEGDIKWDEVCSRLAEIDYDGPLISEVLPAFKYHGEVLWKSVSGAIDYIKSDIEKYRKGIE